MWYGSASHVAVRAREVPAHTQGSDAPAIKRFSDCDWQMYAPRSAAMSISVRCLISHTVLRGEFREFVRCQ